MIRDPGVRFVARCPHGYDVEWVAYPPKAQKWVPEERRWEYWLPTPQPVPGCHAHD